MLVLQVVWVPFPYLGEKGLDLELVVWRGKVRSSRIKVVEELVFLERLVLAYRELLLCIDRGVIF